MKKESGWGFTTGERRAIILICAAALIGAGYRYYQRPPRPQSVHLTAEDSAAIAAISLSLGLSNGDLAVASSERTLMESDSNGSPQPPEPQSVIDLNEATREQLETLPGIGPVLAQRIVETREQMGGFQDLEELLEVPGIGQRRLEKIRPWIICRERNLLLNSDLE